MSKFVHLHTHSEFSVLDGMSRVTEIVEKAVEYGHSAVAITDHGNMGSVPKFYEEAKNNKIEPIIGQEFYIVEDVKKTEKGEQSHHLVLLARNYDGYRTLCRLSAIAAENFYYRPRIDHNILRYFGSDLKDIMATSTCMSGEIPNAIMNNKPKKAKRLLSFYNSVFPNFFLEFMQHGDVKSRDRKERKFAEDEEKINETLWEYHTKYDIPIVVTNDSHYPEPTDSWNHEFLLAIQTGAKIDDSSRFKFRGDGYHITDTSDMRNHFPKAIWKASEQSMDWITKNTRIRIPELENKEHYLPSTGVKSPSREVRRLSIVGVNSRVPVSKHKRYIKQLDYELEVIKKAKVENIFLVADDYVKDAKKHDKEVGSGRGSMAGVLTSYLMGITDVDPIRFNLSFERAINPARPSLPDFDIDFDDKDHVVAYLRKRYGTENVLQIGTLNRMHPRSTLQKILKCLNYDFRTAVAYSQQLPDTGEMIANRSSRDIREILEVAAPDIKQLLDDDPRILELMVKFDGLVQSVGKHAGGVLISAPGQPIRDIVPITKISAEKEPVSQFDKIALEKQFGFVKFDILGLSTLRVVKQIKKLIGNEVLFKDFPDNDNLDDEKVFKLINSGSLTGIFQLEGFACRQAIPQIGGIHDFEDIVSIASIVRPGVTQFIPVFAANRKKKNKFKKVNVQSGSNEKGTIKIHGIKKLDKILESTEGVILFQEQVMAIAQHIAGFDMIRVDDIKEKIKAKATDEFDDMRLDFINGCVEQGYKIKTADYIWDMIRRAAGYLYNRAHAVSYSLITYQTAYLKANYPLEFFTVCINMAREGKKDRQLVALHDEALDLGIKFLRPSLTRSETWCNIEDDKIRMGLAMVKGVGETTASEIVSTRNEMGVRRTLKVLPKKVLRVNVIKALKEVGAYGNKYADEDKQVALLGFSLRDHLSHYRKRIKKASYEKGNEVLFGGQVTEVRKQKTKNGDDMAFAKISFGAEQNNVVLFSDQLADFGNDFKVGNILLVYGKKQPNYSSIIPEGVELLNGN